MVIPISNMLILAYVGIFLHKRQVGKLTFPITIFNFGPDGDYNHKGTLTSARIDEVSVSWGDEGMQLDVSGIALGYDSA